jgi:hypothetical protein
MENFPVSPRRLGWFRKKLYACRLKRDLLEEAASLLTEAQKDELKMSSTLLSGLKYGKKWRYK